MISIVLAFLALLSLSGHAAQPGVEAPAHESSIRDSHFQNGLTLMDPLLGKLVPYGMIVGPNATKQPQQPMWQLAQWSSKNPLKADAPSSMTSGGVHYSNDGKSVIVGLPQTKAADLKPLAQVPPVAGGEPEAGKRIVVTEPEYAGTDVCHSLYLPVNFEKGKKHPLIVEYAGNYHPASGSTGRVQDTHLGFSLTLGRDFIWLVLPFVSKDGRHNEVTWWGDEEATVAYAKKCIPRVIEQFSGDPNAVILCGFSRGSIAVSYIGLHDDAIAGLWSGFVTSDHFDGELEWKGTSWGYPLAHYREEAVARLRRVHGRPFCVNQNGSVEVIRSFLESGGLLANGNYTLQAVPMKLFFPTVPNAYFKAYHTDLWPLFDTPCGKNARQWLSLWLARRGSEESGQQ